MQVLAHNLLAQYSNRELNISSGKKAKVSEKLSSGYRINRSADDAAGLSISEKMRSQIRGLNQASRNIQDGVSLVQVADGALSETHEILQRMRELSVQAANDTNQDIDRTAIQAEIDMLTKEVDRIADVTSFNSEIYPLKDGNSTIGNDFGLNDSGSNWQLPDCLYSKQHTISLNPGAQPVSVDGVTYTSGQSVTIPIVGFQMEDQGKTYYSYHLDVKSDIYGADYYNNYKSSLDDLEIHGITIVSSSTNNNRQFYSTELSDLKIEKDTGYVYMISKNSGDKVYFYKETDPNIIDMPHSFGTTTNPNNISVYATMITGTNASQSAGQSQNASNQSDKIWIQSGANEMQGLFIDLVDATAKGIGITDPTLDVSDYVQASTSISRLDTAIHQVSAYRSHFGAYQNRLEHAMAVDDNTAENTQHAESRIRDMDMAEAMVEYSKYSILEQAGQAVLSQANQMTSGVIQLLQ